MNCEIASTYLYSGERGMQLISGNVGVVLLESKQLIIMCEWLYVVAHKRK